MLSGDDDRLAVVDLQEQDLWNPRRHTWKELRELVRTYASALRSSGLGKGDVVACMYPCIVLGTPARVYGLTTRAVIGSNCVRSLALLLATASVGGMFASFATDIGEKASQSCTKVISVYFPLTPS